MKRKGRRTTRDEGRGSARWELICRDGPDEPAGVAVEGRLRVEGSGSCVGGAWGQWSQGWQQSLGKVMMAAMILSWS